MVDLWRRAETGVGPSMAAGNHGCKLNWADFPAAATIIPRMAHLESFLQEKKIISFKFQDFI